MDFNHLIDKKQALMSCKQRNEKLCKWRPVSEGEATIGEKVSLRMMCDRCNSRTCVFLEQREYKIHEKVIIEEVENG